MPKGIILLGPSGSGKTTLRKLVAGRLGAAFLDIDDYIWKKDTAIPYTVMYTKAEKIKRLMDAMEKSEEFIMAGSMTVNWQNSGSGFCQTAICLKRIRHF